MAIPKKGSRKIVVKDIEYRWLIRRKATYAQTAYGIGKLSVAIELAEAPGTTLLIYTDRNHPKDFHTQKVIPIIPSDIANWILQALELGWKPFRKGKQFQTLIENGLMMMKE